ncbi:hypothetical protein QE243_02985, partial [Klebsiella pneumoniae]
PTGNKREAITNSLQKAAAFSAQICLKEGAFGYGTHYKPITPSLIFPY